MTDSTPASLDLTAQRSPTAARGAFTESDRILELDALRGICATAVMLYHYLIRYDAIVGFSGSSNPAADVDLHGLRDLATLPVFVFFIISGFVIYMTLEKVRGGTEFFVSRASRILPAYWVAVLLTHTAWEYQPAYPYHISLSELLVNLTMLQSFFYIPDVDGVYWSLGVEIAFYFWMWMLLVTRRLHWMRPVCAVWLLIAIVHGIGGGDAPFYYRITLALDLKYAHFFVAGIVAYRIWRRRHDRADWALLAMSAVSLMLHHIPQTVLIIFVLYTGFLSIAFGRLRALATPPLVFLGSISYSLYLIHQMLGYQIISAFSPWPVLGVSMAIFVSLVLAYLITRFVEKPAVRLARTKYNQWVKRDPIPADFSRR